MLTDEMTLRDWYIGQALNGMLSNSGVSERPSSLELFDIAKTAIKIADTIMSERIKPNGDELAIKARKEKRNGRN